jgi:hypothetical protein
MKIRKATVCEKAHKNVHENPSVDSKLGADLLGGTDTRTTPTFLIKLHYGVNQ